MTRDEFIQWVENTSGFSRWSAFSDIEYREEMNYSENIWDELTVEENHVVFSWEELYWGGRDFKTRECGFEEFIRLYESYNLKN